MDLQLLAFVDTKLINLAIVFRSHKLECSIVAKCTPLGVDQHVLLAIGRCVIQFTVLHALNITRIASGSFDKENFNYYYASQGTFVRFSL